MLKYESMVISGFSLNISKLLNIVSENIEKINAKKINASRLLNKLFSSFFI
jgi:hypothetical protein